MMSSSRLCRKLFYIPKIRYHILYVSTVESLVYQNPALERHMFFPPHSSPKTSTQNFEHKHWVFAATRQKLCQTELCFENHISPYHGCAGLHALRSPYVCSTTSRKRHPSRGMFRKQMMVGIWVCAGSPSRILTCKTVTRFRNVWFEVCRALIPKTNSKITTGIIFVLARAPSGTSKMDTSESHGFLALSRAHIKLT
jgi:hypothetical protein